MKLGVNIDHIATLREARKEGIPNVIAAAKEVLVGGADGIVCHLREDRRHINDADVLSLKKIGCRLDLEMAATDEMLKIALKLRPEMVTLVPEKRQELTTEGGLDLTKNRTKLVRVIGSLQQRGIQVSLFIDPDKKQLTEAAVLTADFVELHTGAYARKPSARNLEQLGLAVEQARLTGLRVNAGHGLDYHNVAAVARIAGIEELNIGFSIIARSVFVGLKRAVAEMRKEIDKK
jgi:pyridoxine 5-phosphate synthase